MNGLETTEIRELTENELDLASGGVIVFSLDFFGTRYVVGVDGAGGGYACANGPSGGTCIRSEPL